MDAKLYWVVALMPEAKVVINRFDLKKVSPESGLFPIYESNDGCTRLIVSGIGKVNAAAATATLGGLEDAPRGGVGWINFGIAGCSEARYGEACLASRVTDQGTGRSWYPVPTWSKKADLSRLPVTTVEMPVSDYSSVSGLVEMEASGFYGIALKQSTVELVHVLKVVSDDPEHSIEALNPKIASRLCEEAWTGLEPWLEAFRGEVQRDALRISDPAGFVEWSECFRLTTTQQHQLRRLLQEWQSLSDDAIVLPDADVGAKASLQILRDQLKQLREHRFHLP